ncbi:MAG: leucyl aminopeptidase [Cellulomonadaceae bacterium]|nr:leucyl aminopeptidase [Cellulomonadaceae bacterium]
MTTIDLTPSRRLELEVRVVLASDALDVDALAVPVTSDGEVPEVLGVDLAALARSGFTPSVGKAIAFPGSGAPVLVAVGVGSLAALDAAGVRDAAAAFSTVVPHDARLATRVPSTATLAPDVAAAAIVEGVLLARYRFSLRSTPSVPVPVTELVLVAGEGDVDAVRAGAARGTTMARAAMLGRDLATCPAGLMTATAIGQIATDLAAGAGLEVEVVGKDALRELGIGGLLGVNKGSVEPPAMVVVTYRPSGEPTGHLGLVGKGIMYDSGGISLKPGDLSHSQMKNDMTGAGDILAAMSVLAELGCSATVTGWLMCTDNMPSGSAMQLGDVLFIHGGKTVEVLNTDAEGRLVMADALVLATEAGVDAIVDIATLTGASLRTFGTEIAAVMGNDDDVVAQVTAAGARVDEPVWRLPLVRSYRRELDTPIADIANLGGPNAGAITAGLFLEEFVGSTPWAHIDIAGTAQAPADSRWIPKGPTAFGTRLLVELALGFRAPAS